MLQGSSDDHVNDLGFAMAYTCRILPEMPKTQTAVLQFFDEPDPSRLGLLVEVKPSTSPSWIGSFQPCHEDYPLTGVYACPSPEQVCIVNQGAGYLVNVNQPSNWERIHVIPILGVQRVPDRPILLFWDFQDLAAYGPEGLLWRIERLSNDGLTITEVTASAITGISCRPLNRTPYEEEVPFRIDPLTGKTEGGRESSGTRFRRSPQ